MSYGNLIVKADLMRKEDFLSRLMPADFGIRFWDGIEAVGFEGVKAIFLLEDFNTDLSILNSLPSRVPVFINAVDFDLKKVPSHLCVARVNGWPGFLRNPVLEISYQDKDILPVENLLMELSWSFIRIADQPGMAVPRVIAMLINEACYAVNEKVSSKEEIDTAMKLGTSYPFGPFEWSRIIGPARVLSLLETLAANDKRYLPAPMIRKTLGL